MEDYMTKKQKIKRIIKRLLSFLKRIFSSFYIALLKLKIVKPKMIVRMDGGISSQMHQYLLGRIFREKGYMVTYDLSFYKKWAKDNNGHFERNFDLLKAFPQLEFKQSNWIDSMAYSIYFADKTDFFDHEEDDIFLYDLKPPKFLGGYYHSPSEVWRDLVPNYFRIDPQILDSYSYALYAEIEKNIHSVGVHIRRGDLKVFNNAYGRPVDFDYFYKAISYICSKIETPFFYFFSDEPQWIEDELIEKLPVIDGQYKIVNKNGSDKGYMDLFLLASCRHQITSKGTFGKLAALLKDSRDKIVILSDDSIEYVWKKRLLNPVYL